MFDLQEFTLAVAAYIAVFGVVLSWLLEKVPGIKTWWKEKVPKAWKPWILWLTMEVIAILPVPLVCVGSLDGLVGLVKWVPDIACDFNSILFSSLVGLMAYATSQMTFFKLLGNGKVS